MLTFTPVLRNVSSTACASLAFSTSLSTPILSTSSYILNTSVNSPLTCNSSANNRSSCVSLGAAVTSRSIWPGASSRCPRRERSAVANAHEI